jgi:hypothetical protein
MAWKKKAKFEIHFGKTKSSNLLNYNYVLNIWYWNYRITKALGCTITDSDNWPRCIQIA